MPPKSRSTTPPIPSEMSASPPAGLNPLPNAAIFVRLRWTLAAFAPSSFRPPKRARQGGVTHGAQPSRLHQDHRRRTCRVEPRRSRLRRRAARRSPPRSGRSSSTAATETRNTCTYCSVACGILIYSLGDRAKNAKSDIIHIEGDPDHPVNRGTLCPKGSALLDIVHAPDAADKSRNIARPGGNEFKQVSWDFRAGPHRDADEGRTATRTSSPGTRTGSRSTAGSRTGMLAASASSNETALPHLEGRPLARHGGLRQSGARLTRTDGGQSGPNIRSRRDDQHLAGHQERQCRAWSWAATPPRRIRAASNG